MAATHSLAEVEKFVSTDLRKRLKADLRNHKMLREAELECSVYYHLRKFLEQDDHWRLFARKYSGKIGRYPDLLILMDKHPVIAMELKWRRGEISHKDREVLGDCLKKLKVNKVYFITTVKEKADYEKLGWKKRPGEKYRLKEITVRLDLRGARRQKWEKERETYKEAIQ